LVLAGGVSGCGPTSSASTSASRADFCRTFDRLGTGTTPRRAADELSRVGTPSDIGASARRGFAVLVEHLRDLPPNTSPGEVTQMVQHLHTETAADVRAFIAYYAVECRRIPSDSST
jgi:hypothetical protein